MDLGAFIKRYGFLSFANNFGENLGAKYSQIPLGNAKNLVLMHLKLPQREQFKKQQKQLVI